jgi:hypothetical protein
MRLRSMSWLAAVALLSVTTPAWAVDVTAGNTVTPSTMTNPLTESGFSVVASTSGTFSTPAESGTYSAYVVKESSGTLDFVYKFENDASSASKLERMTAYNFAGFTTNVGYVAGTGDVAPFSADRTTDGKVVGFNFLAPRSVSPGDNTDIMVIKTDATNFTAGTYTFQDGGATTVAAYAPALATPEPSSLLSLGLGGIVVFGIARRRKSARV